MQTDILIFAATNSSTKDLYDYPYCHCTDKSKLVISEPFNIVGKVDGWIQRTSSSRVKNKKGLLCRSISVPMSTCEHVSLNWDTVTVL